MKLSHIYHFLLVNGLIHWELGKQPDRKSQQPPHARVFDERTGVKPLKISLSVVLKMSILVLLSMLTSYGERSRMYLLTIVMNSS